MCFIFAVGPDINKFRQIILNLTEIKLGVRYGFTMFLCTRHMPFAMN